MLHSINIFSIETVMSTGFKLCKWGVKLQDEGCLTIYIEVIVVPTYDSLEIYHWG